MNDIEIEDSAYLGDFTNEKDREKLLQWMKRSVKMVDEASKRGEDVYFHTVNHHRSPWLSHRIANRVEASAALDNREPVPFLTAALVEVPLYWLPYPPPIASVVTSEDKPKYVSAMLEYLDKRSIIYSDLVEILSDTSISSKRKYRRSKSLLKDATGFRKVLSPGREYDFNLWHFVAGKFLTEGHWKLAADLYEVLLNHLADIQDSDNLAYKGDILATLGFIYLEQNLTKESEKNLVSALIEDLIHFGGTEKSPAKSAVFALFDYTEEEVTEIESVIDKSESVVDPRVIYARFKPISATISIRRYFDNLVNIDSNIAAKLMEEVENAGTNIEKKDTLEKYSEYVFGFVDGFEALPSRRTRTGEIDRIVRNNRLDHPFFVWIGEYFIIEAKNWRDSIAAREVRVLSTRMRESDCRLGILMTRKGLTSDAQEQVRAAYLRDKIVIVTFDDTDYDSINKGENIIVILRNKKEKIVFG